MNPAELVMNCPDLRNLILSHRSEIMEKQYIKRIMAPTLRAIENNVISDNSATEWTIFDSDGDWWRWCYRIYDGKLTIWEMNEMNPNWLPRNLNL